MIHAWTQSLLYLALLIALAVPLGPFMARVMEGERTFLHPVLGPLERGLYRLMGIRGDEEMGWKAYAWAIGLFNLLGLVALFLLQKAQGALPLNPEGMAKLPTDLAVNTAVSFVTNTNWQAYGGESTLSYLTQMLGLTVQNFLSAATALAVAVALIRGFVRRSSEGLGNAWADLVRSTLYLLLPLSVVMALMLVGQGAVQTFSAHVTTASGQVLALGPAASQVAIKMIGTNGGGFFNANSAHPFENPTPLSNFAQMLAIFLIPAALCFSFGQLVGDWRQGLAILAAMSVLFITGVAVATAAEQAGNPRLQALQVDQRLTMEQSGGNMEGKETRFGINASSLFAVVTTAASCGAVNTMHDSLTPIGGMVPLVMMQLGEVVFGGVGTGLYGMLVFAILAVFIAGLMIGRTPEYLGKKIESHEMKMVSIAILVTPLVVLLGTALAVLAADGKAGIANPGAHGFSEVLYALTSAGNNNGSAFAGLSANTPFYNTLLGIVMWLGRFGVIVPVLALAGSLAAKKRIPTGNGTLPTHGPLFVALLIGVVLLVGLLNYVPSLALGPIVEQLMLWTA